MITFLVETWDTYITHCTSCYFSSLSLPPSLVPFPTVKDLLLNCNFIALNFCLTQNTNTNNLTKFMRLVFFSLFEFLLYFLKRQCSNENCLLVFWFNFKIESND